VCRRERIGWRVLVRDWRQILENRPTGANWDGRAKTSGGTQELVSVTCDPDPEAVLQQLLAALRGQLVHGGAIARLGTNLLC